jgi:transketolase
MNKTQLSNFENISKALRILSADVVENAKSGHPGMPLGFADVFSVLISEFLRYNPKDPSWNARDRLVFSAGHGSALLYSFLHLAGYDDYTIDQLKNFRKIGFITPGHPEFNINLGIETTTGPLGQGFANSVGMAIAQKKYEQEIGVLAEHKIYCIIGDGCLMEGITHEAASIAGHLKLNNLIALFDSNNISIDGNTSLTTSDDHVKKFEALGWNARIVDGHNYEEIYNAIKDSQASDKPVLIECKTKIGFGSGEKENSEKSHGSPLGSQALKHLREILNWQFDAFDIPKNIYDNFEKINIKNLDLYNKWKAEFKKLDEEKTSFYAYPRIDGIIDKISSISLNPYENNSSRKSSGKVLEAIAKSSKKVVFGSADLSESNCILNQYSKVITKNDFSGNFIHFGVRENAMAAIVNGIASQGFLCFCSSFLVFSDYMRPAIRLSAIMGLPVVYIMTHDSIGLGEDGCTHQPIEHLASFREMPNINVYRPCDMQEVMDCYVSILTNDNTPSIIALSRQNLQQFKFALSRREGVMKGAYLFDNPHNFIDVSIWATGSEMEIAFDVKEMLEKVNISACIISSPCLDVFEKQTQEYKNSLLSKGKIKVVIEAATSGKWHKYVGSDGIFFGLEEFGRSGPAEDVYSYFNLTSQFITNKIIERIGF